MDIHTEDIIKQSLLNIEAENYSQAIEDLMQLTRTHHDLPAIVWKHMALCHEHIRQYELAIAAYHQALAIEDNIQTHLELFYSNLILGNYLEGFRRMETRIQYFGKTPGWQGEEIVGKTVNVIWEIGLGDTIQFLRYVPLLKTLGCNVVVNIQPELSCLFPDLVSSCQSSDLHVYMMSLPYCFRTELHTIPPPTKIPCRLSPKKGRVGIAWQGNKLNTYDKHRTVPLLEFIPLFCIPGIEYVCVQKEVSEEEQALLARYNVKRPPINNFLDTVHILEECEHVVSSCTSVAHLAASMGVPTLIALGFYHCWRWLKDRSDSPWYPSVRLFRQKKNHDWSVPMGEIGGYLREKQWKK
jgi:hypothetical protein